MDTKIKGHLPDFVNSFFTIESDTDNSLHFASHFASNFSLFRIHLAYSFILNSIPKSNPFSIEICFGQNKSKAIKSSFVTGGVNKENFCPQVACMTCLHLYAPQGARTPASGSGQLGIQHDLPAFQYLGGISSADKPSFRRIGS